MSEIMDFVRTKMPKTDGRTYVEWPPYCGFCGKMSGELLERTREGRVAYRYHQKCYDKWKIDVAREEKERKARWKEDNRNA